MLSGSATAVCLSSPNSRECPALLIRSPIPGCRSRHHPQYPRSLTRAFKILNSRRMRLLNIAVIFFAEHASVIMVSAFPSLVVRWAEHLRVQWRAWIREHRHRFAHPDAIFLQILLPSANLIAIVMVGKNEVRLHPRDALLCIDQQPGEPLS